MGYMFDQIIRKRLQYIHRSDMKIRNTFASYGVCIPLPHPRSSIVVFF